ncbi:MAG: hypothetical protein CMI52_00855 [Parcubacteria group bacterium]|nr:hypothetical protein [Parcubacteria group bacterium]
MHSVVKGGIMYDSGDEFRLGLLVGMMVASIIAITAYGWFHIISMLVSGITLVLCIPYLVGHCTRQYLRAHRTHRRSIRSTTPRGPARTQRIKEATHLNVVEKQDPS